MDDRLPQFASTIIRLHLFGRFRLERALKPLSLPTRKVEALLAYLVLNPQPHRREKAAALFWGDFSDEQARASLRNALPAIRRQLGPDGLVAGRETVQFNPAYPLWVDALAFQQQAREFLAGSLPPAAVDLDLYQGDLLADFYDDWIISERERYHALYLETLLQMARHWRTAGEYEQAIAVAHRLLQAEPAHEQAHQNLMVCYLALGDRQAALKQYELCRRALRDELDVAPQPETVALYQQIRQAPATRPSADARLTNLPTPLTRFIGRQPARAEIRRLLTEGRTRLLTLTGPGGGGKTRLAIAVAAGLNTHFDDGVWWVELAALADPQFVSQVVAKTLGLRETAIGAQATLSLVATLAGHLVDRRLLLVLDNCEHLVVACAQLVAALLPACPHLQILTTSREPLGVTGETVWPVLSLSLPGAAVSLSPAGFQESDAVHLFVERAAAVAPGFELTAANAAAVVQICRQLDGIPLAIELAAARASVFNPHQIAGRLDDRLNLLTAGNRAALPRHQTLRAALDWSHDLLDEAEQRLFRRLAVFAGGFTLAAAGAVCAEKDEDIASSLILPPSSFLDLLAQLVQKSLAVVENQAEEARYRLLETIRQYAYDKLWLAGEETAVRQRHLEWFAQMAGQAEPELLGANQEAWIERLSGEYANLSAALRWAVTGATADVETGLRLGGALWRFWDQHGYVSEGRERLEKLLSLYPLRNAIRAQALISAGILVHLQGDSPAAVGLFGESLVIAEELGDPRGRALALHHLGFVAHRLSDYATARSHYEISLALWRQGGDRWGTAETLGNLGMLAYREGGGDLALSRTLLEESLAIKREIGDKRGMTLLLWALGNAALWLGQYERARALYLESLQLAWQMADKWSLPFCLEGLAYLAVAERFFERAAHLFAAAEALRDATHAPLPPVWLADYEQALATIGAALDAHIVTAAWTEGRAMPLGQAVAYALQ